MQKLEYQDQLGNEVAKDYPVPADHSGINVHVEDGKGDVVLTVGTTSVHVSIYGARDIALALRQSANRIEKLNRQ